jgi:hypothetical protein
MSLVSPSVKAHDIYVHATVSVTLCLGQCNISIKFGWPVKLSSISAITCKDQLLVYQKFFSKAAQCTR